MQVHNRGRCPLVSLLAIRKGIKVPPLHHNATSNKAGPRVRSSVSLPFRLQSLSRLTM